MSDFPRRAPQIWAMGHAFKDRNFVPGITPPFSVCVAGAPARNGMRCRLARFRGITPEEVNGCRDDIGPCGRFWPACSCALRSRPAKPCAPSPPPRGHRPRQGADGGRRLRKLPHRRSRQTVCRGQAYRYAVRRHLFAQPDPRPRYRDRRAGATTISTARCASASHPTVRAITRPSPTRISRN